MLRSISVDPLLEPRGTALTFLVEALVAELRAKIALDVSTVCFVSAVVTLFSLMLKIMSNNDPDLTLLAHYARELLRFDDDLQKQCGEVAASALAFSVLRGMFDFQLSQAYDCSDHPSWLDEWIDFEAQQARRRLTAISNDYSISIRALNESIDVDEFRLDVRITALHSSHVQSLAPG